MTGLIVVLAAFGLFLLVSALANWDWYKGITDFAVVETLLGENAARWTCGIAGLALTVFGIVCLVQRR